jgi:hypothetical protein
MLASGLINNISVVHIDLSNNKIADRGVRAFAKLLHVNGVIQFVNLANNQVRRPPFTTDPAIHAPPYKRACNSGITRCENML